MKWREIACVFYLQRFKETSNEIQLPKACEFAGLMRRVSIGKYYKSVHDVDDVCECTTGAFSEFPSPREDPNSDIIALVGGHI